MDSLCPSPPGMMEGVKVKKIRTSNIEHSSVSTLALNIEVGKGAASGVKLKKLIVGELRVESLTQGMRAGGGAG